MNIIFIICIVEMKNAKKFLREYLTKGKAIAAFVAKLQKEKDNEKKRVNAQFMRI
jgi:hypothetical protein